MPTYIFYAWPDGPQIVYILPPGDTVEDFVERYGFLPNNWAILDPADFDPDCIYYPSAFTITSGNPNTLSFSLAAAKAYAIEQVKIYTAQTVENGQFLQNYTSATLAAQASLDPVDRDPNVQAVLDNINTEVDSMNQGIANINSATTLAAVYTIQQSYNNQ